jgi:N-acetylglucosaminyldiphosphoundecaprenol N-acetyl-beta-D-mannosaminyltransferase
MNTPEITTMLGIPISTSNLSDIVERAIASIDGRAPQAIIACANPHALVVAHEDALFRTALQNATYVLPDGIGVVWASRLSRQPIRRRIAGWDFFESLMRALETRGKGRLFFLGSSQAVLDKIAARLSHDFPQITLCGLLSPPFGRWAEGANDEILDEISRALPDVLWVGMTAPKQERWVEENRHRLPVAVIGSVGAVFDFYAGAVERAPPWLQRAGLEWFPRLLRDPRRLWRRTFVSGPIFVGLVLREFVYSIDRSVR